MSPRTESGLAPVGALPWGTHFCQFYRTGDDLVGTLVPFFQAGLLAGESCLWVTSQPLQASEALAAIRTAVPDVDARIARGQLTILDHEQWYLRAGLHDPGSIVQGWLEREQRALAGGYEGLRLTGNTFWLEHNQYTEFGEYEAQLNVALRGHRVLALCSYCLDRCRPEDVVDVTRSHEFAILRRKGDWEMFESAALARTKEELLRLNQDLEERVASRTHDLIAALQVRESFLSLASHELRTPITTLHLALETLARAEEHGEAPDDELSRLRVLRALRQVRRLERLVSQLLDVSRGELLPVAPSPGDLGEVIQEVATSMQEALRRAGCDLAVDATRLPALFDATRIAQAIENLLANAIRHAAGSHVRLAVVRDGSDAVLSVEDDGPGIPPADRERVFGRFEQLERGRGAGGFGLGLWLVRQVALAHGGSACVDERPGGGARFSLRIPLAA